MYEEALVWSGSSLCCYLTVGHRTDPPPLPFGRRRSEYVAPEDAVEVLREGLREEYEVIIHGVFALMCEHGLWFDCTQHPPRQQTFKILAEALLDPLPHVHMVRVLPDNWGSTLKEQRLVIEEIEPPQATQKTATVRVSVIDDLGRPLKGHSFKLNYDTGEGAGGSLDDKGSTRLTGIPPGRFTTVVSGYDPYDYDQVGDSLGKDAIYGTRIRPEGLDEKGVQGQTDTH